MPLSSNAQGQSDVHPAKAVAQQAAQLDAPTLAAHLHGLNTGLWQWTFPPQDRDQHFTSGAVEGSVCKAAHGSDQQPLPPTSFDATLITSPALLTAFTRAQIFDLFQRNLQSSYELNSAWNPAEKKDEMFDAQQQGRWILLWERSTKAAQGDQSKEGEEEEERSLVGFILWRFDTEECTKVDWTERDETRREAAGEGSPSAPLQKKRVLPLPSAKRGPGGKGRLVVKRPKVERLLPVGYCYELSISPSHSSTGLGSALLSSLSHLSTHTGMRKVMLTCWRCNTAALRFYLHKCKGWEVDGISPRGVEVDEEDEVGVKEEERKGYVILSWKCK